MRRKKKKQASKKGDAASWMTARAIIASSSSTNPGNKPESKWLATSGTGSLFTYLSQRSMRIALLPLPDRMLNAEREELRERMINLTVQLPEVDFHLLVTGLIDQSKISGVVADHNNITDQSYDPESPEAVIKYVSDKVEIPPLATLVVSDRDDYLRVAKENKMFTCRVRKKNSPTGNVTTNYNVEKLVEIKDVINDINGISFSAVFSKSK